MAIHFQVCPKHSNAFKETNQGEDEKEWNYDFDKNLDSDNELRI